MRLDVNCKFEIIMLTLNDDTKTIYAKRTISERDKNFSDDIEMKTTRRFWTDRVQFRIMKFRASIFCCIGHSLIPHSTYQNHIILIIFELFTLGTFRLLRHKSFNPTQIPRQGRPGVTSSIFWVLINFFSKVLQKA